MDSVNSDSGMDFDISSAANVKIQNKSLTSNWLSFGEQQHKIWFFVGQHKC